MLDRRQLLVRIIEKSRLIDLVASGLIVYLDLDAETDVRPEDIDYLQSELLNLSKLSSQLSHNVYYATDRKDG